MKDGFKFPKLSGEELEGLAEAILLELEGLAGARRGAPLSGGGRRDKNRQLSELSDRLAFAAGGEPDDRAALSAARRIREAAEELAREEAALVRELRREAAADSRQGEEPQLRRLFKEGLAGTARRKNSPEADFSAIPAGPGALSDAAASGGGRPADMNDISEFFRRDSRRYDSGFELL